MFFPNATAEPKNDVIDLNSGRRTPVVRYALDSVDSTQVWSREHLPSVPLEGWLAVTAKQQTGGLGTSGRKWHSPLGNVYASFSIRLPENVYTGPSANINQLRLPQITGLAVSQALEGFGLNPKIKWVNDVLLGGKKISGISVELHGNVLIIGIGINVNMSMEEAAQVNEVCIGDPNKIPATSLLLEVGRVFDIESVFQKLQQRLYTNMDLHFRGELDFVREIESRLTCRRGDEVRVQQDQIAGCPLEPECNGHFIGLNSYGAAEIFISGKGKVEINTGRMSLPIANCNQPSP